jgi:hypothetical protein
MGLSRNHLAMTRNGKAEARRSTQQHVIGVDVDWRFNGLPLGLSLRSITPDHLKTHALVIGATGSGKTVLLHHLMAQDILEGHSFAVLDMRGDLVAAALALLEGRVDPKKVLLYDLREKENPLGFNPILGPGEPYFRALGVLDVVRAASDSWGVQLDETLRNALLLLAEGKQTLVQLERVFHDEAYRSLLLEHCTSDSVLNFFERYGELSSEKKQNMAMPVMNKLSMLLSAQALVRTLGHQSPPDLGRHLNTKGSVTLVSLAVDELHSAGVMLGGMLLSSLTREIFARVTIPEEERNPVRLYVDEFEHFSMGEFENILAEGRRFGLNLVLAHQTLAQLTPVMRSLILGNVGVKVMFRCSHSDAKALSTDITGNPHELELASQFVGCCTVWWKHMGIRRIEVNPPLISSTDTRSPEVLAFMEQIKARNPEFTGVRVARARKVEAEAEAEVSESSLEPHKPKTQDVVAQSLEDWL